MLPTLHNRAYQDFLTLLTDFRIFAVNAQNKTDLAGTKQEFQKLEEWFKQNISHLEERGIDIAYIPRWQSIQREINREFKLLTTDILFLASARQDATKNKRFKSIENRIDQLINYCHGMLQEANKVE